MAKDGQVPCQLLSTAGAVFPPDICAQASGDRNKTGDELGLAEEDQVTEPADHAQARPLRQAPDDQSGRKADGDS